MSGPPGAAESDSAVRLFLSWVEEHGEARGPAFEDLCASHPGLRPRLVAIGSLHEKARALLEDSSGEPGVEVLPAAPENALVGTRYEPRGEIARGGMGTILEAFDPSLRRTVAVKILRTRPGKPDSPPDRARHRSRLLAEAQVLAQLDHPGVVPLYEAGRDERGEPYFTMKRVEGQDFQAVIRAYRAGDGFWRLARAVVVLKRASEAVAYAHAKGVIHRDLKPANLMVGRFGEVFVMDWGLAKVLGQAEPGRAAGPGAAELAVETERALSGEQASDTQHGAVLGTLEYMAPEQASGELAALDARTDVYALGAMLYHLLAGRAPHAAGRNEAGLLRKTPEPLERVARGAPEELVAISEKAMSVRPGARYPTALELARELEAWLEGRVVRAHRTGAWVELRKWVGRNRGAAAAIAAVGLGLGTTALVQVVLRRQLTVQASELRREDALNRIALASAAYSNGDIAHMQAFLTGCPEDLRGWEWNYLTRAADTSARTFQVEDGLELNDACLLEERQLLVAAATGTPTRVEVWDLASGQRERVLALPEGDALNNLSLSADGERMAGFGKLGALWLWDTHAWQVLARLDVRLHGWHGVAFAPQDRRLAAFGTEGVELWDAETRVRLAHLSAGQKDIADVTWSPDGTRLAASSWDGSLSIWDVREARLEELLRVTDARLQQVEWSPDGRWIAGGDWDSYVHVWDARTLRPEYRSDRLGGHVLALAWSPDARILAVGGHGVVIRLLEADSWESVGRLVGHGANVRSLEFTPSGRTLVSTCALGTMRLWDLECQDWYAQSRPQKLQGPAGVAFAPDGRHVAVGWNDGSVEIWDPRARAIEQRFTCPTGVRHVDWSRGAPRLALTSWENDVFLYDAVRPASARRLAVAEPTEAHFDPTGSLLAVTAQDGTVRVFELEKGHLLWREAVSIERDAWPGRLFGASWSPAGTELVTGTQDGRIQVRDGFTGVLRRETVRPGMLFAQFSGDGRHVLAWAYERNQGMELLDAETLALLWSSGHTNHMWPVTSSGAARVFSANWQGLLGVWDLADGRLLAEIEALPPGNPRLAVSPDGACVVLAAGGRVGFLDAGRERGDG